MWDALREGVRSALDLARAEASTTATDRSRPPAEPLLPGEAPESDVREDAEHWVAVYEELVSFLDDVHAADCGRFSAFRTRLAYWRHRRAELGS